MVLILGFSFVWQIFASSAIVARLDRIAKFIEKQRKEESNG